jgi:hypothetical protein
VDCGSDIIFIAGIISQSVEMTDQQPDSDFLRLPCEIRLQVYEEILKVLLFQARQFRQLKPSSWRHSRGNLVILRMWEMQPTILAGQPTIAVVQTLVKIASTCRLVRYELLSMFMSQLTMVVSMPTSLESNFAFRYPCPKPLLLPWIRGLVIDTNDLILSQQPVVTVRRLLTTFPGLERVTIRTSLAAPLTARPWELPKYELYSTIVVTNEMCRSSWPICLAKRAGRAWRRLWPLKPEALEPPALDAPEPLVPRPFVRLYRKCLSCIGFE